MVEQTPIADHSADRVRERARRLPFAISVRWGGVALAGALAVTGLVFVWQSTMLGLGGVGLPGPGFFPLVLGVLVAVLSLVIGIERWRAPSTQPAVELGHTHALLPS